MADLKLNKVVKRFGEVQTIHGVDLDIKHGEFVVFVGPSGCGKSTLLRMIAGLETISDGEVVIDEQTVNDVSPSDRGIAMVFQSYALYPHMTVRENMSFGLRLAKKSKAEIEQRVGEASRILKLDHLLDRLELSCVTRRYSCLMNRCRIWMRNCGCRCGSRFQNYTNNSVTLWFT